jgi:hypothetical protein
MCKTVRFLGIVTVCVGGSLCCLAQVSACRLANSSTETADSNPLSGTISDSQIDKTVPSTASPGNDEKKKNCEPPHGYLDRSGGL